MNIFKLLFTLLLITSCDMKDMDKPTPKKIPYELIQHNDIRVDNYYWLRDDSRSDKEVLAYLDSENSYADKWFESGRDYKTDIVNELIEQLPYEEESFPFNNNGYTYFEKLNKGDQLPKFYKKESSESTETLYLDPNIKLKTQKYVTVLLIGTRDQ